jgi:hypothetical protein
VSAHIQRANQLVIKMKEKGMTIAEMRAMLLYCGIDPQGVLDNIIDFALAVARPIDRTALAEAYMSDMAYVARNPQELGASLGSLFQQMLPYKGTPSYGDALTILNRLWARLERGDSISDIPAVGDAAHLIQIVPESAQKQARLVWLGFVAREQGKW